MPGLVSFDIPIFSIFLTADSSETIKLEDLDNEIKHKYNTIQLSIPHYLKTKNQKLIYKFNFILQLLHNELKMNEQYKHEIFNEMKRFHIETIDNEPVYVHQVILVENEIETNNYKKLLRYIEKVKVLLNKLETVNENSLQYDFLFTKLDQLYEILTNNYQINLPAKTSIESIRATLNSIRKVTKKKVQEFENKQDDLLRRLDVIKKKEALKRRTMIVSIAEVNIFNIS